MTTSVVVAIVESKVGTDECNGDVQTGVTTSDVVFDVIGGCRVDVIVLGDGIGVEGHGVDLEVSDQTGCVQAVGGDALEVSDQSG
jgi:hypothetical protein